MPQSCASRRSQGQRSHPLPSGAPTLYSGKTALPTTATPGESTSGSGSGATFTIEGTAGSTPLLFKRLTLLASVWRSSIRTAERASLGLLQGACVGDLQRSWSHGPTGCLQSLYGVQPATDTAVGAFIGLARTSCSSLREGNVIVAEEGDDIPYSATGTNSGQTLKKLTSPLAR